MANCKTCGIEDTKFATKGEFLAHCKQCKKEQSITPDTPELPPATPDEQEQPRELSDEQPRVDACPYPVALPMSACPKELELFPEARQMFLRVTGRRVGEWFVVDRVEMI